MACPHCAFLASLLEVASAAFDLFFPSLDFRCCTTARYRKGAPSRYATAAYRYRILSKETPAMETLAASGRATHSTHNSVTKPKGSNNSGKLYRRRIMLA